MFERQVTIHNERGIHCRPATVIAEALRDYTGRAQVRSLASQAECEASSVLGLMSLGLEAGAEVVARVSGPNEDVVGEKLVHLLETEFDFPVGPAQRA